VQIALYKGKSWVSKAIRWFTRGDYSHAAFRFDSHSAEVGHKLQGQCPFSKLHLFGEGCVVEAWQGGVKNSISIDSLHTPGTPVDIFSLVDPLSDDQEARILRALDTQIGDPYSYLNIIRFLTRKPGDEDGSWFCSELCFQDLLDAGRPLFSNTEAWEVPPHWIARSPLVRFERSLVT